MAKGSPPPVAPTQTTVQKPSEEAQDIMKLAKPYAEQFAAGGGPKLPDYSLIAGFDPLQTQGQQQVLGSVPTQQNVVGQAAQGSQFLNNPNLLSPESNPYLSATMDAATRPLYNNLMESVLPKIRGNAQATGNWGGSRQGIMEGLAIDRTQQAAGDARAKIATSGYQAGLDALAKGQQYAPQIAQAQALPGMTTSGVGDVRQALTQSLLGEQGSRYNYEQTLPLLMAKELYGIASGIPGGTAISTGSVPPQPSSLQQNLGLGIAGAGALGSLLGGSGGFMTGAAKFLPLLMSDRRAKEDIVKLADTKFGLGIYLFRYLSDKHFRLGFMADEVEKVLPKAVEEHNNIKFVNYTMAFEWLLRQEEGEADAA